MKLYFKNNDFEIEISSDDSITTTHMNMFWEMCRDIVKKSPGLSKPTAIVGGYGVTNKLEVKPTQTEEGGYPIH